MVELRFPLHIDRVRQRERPRMPVQSLQVEFVPASDWKTPLVHCERTSRTLESLETLSFQAREPIH